MFAPDLEATICEEENRENIQNMEEEIRKFLNVLSKDGIWGGSESLKAVQHLYKCNILVINELGNFYLPCSFDESVETILILGYRLGANVEKNDENISNMKRNHYDSVISIEPNDIFSIAEVITNRLKQRYMILESTIEIID